MENVNVVDSIKATLYERISNPLLSTFIISWLIWNYKFILVILSSSIDTLEKFDYIKFDLFPFTFTPFFTLSNTCTALFVFIGPILTSALYLFVIYPLLGKKVYKYHKNSIKEYNNIKVDIEGKTSMSEEDVLALKSEYRTIKSIHSKELDMKDNEIEMLKKDLDNATDDAANSRTQLSEIQGKQNQSDDLVVKLTQMEKEKKLKDEKIQRIEKENLAINDQLKYFKDNPIHSMLDESNVETIKNINEDSQTMLKIISHDTGWSFIDSLKNDFNIHRIRFSKALELLIENKLIEMSEKLNKVKITSKGEKYLFDNDLLK